MNDLRDIIKQIPGYDPAKTAGDCRFDDKAAQEAIDFIEECCTHTKGELAGKPLKLETWQKTIIANLFGWKRLDGTRRYRECLIYIPRKNGKTQLAASILCFTLFVDREKGAEILGAAATREQAGLLFDAVRGMIRNEPELSSRCVVFKKAITRDETQSYYKVISADANTAHGANIHAAVIDELHAQPNRELVDVIRTSTASTARRQPLVVYLTTADYDRESICNETLKYAQKVRDGVIAAADFLPVIYGASKTDDWRKEETWRKANPNLGVSVSLDYLRRECQKAQEVPAYEGTFRRLHLNVVTEQANRWLSLLHYDACPSAFDLHDLTGKACYAGLDLSSTSDTTALVLYFPESQTVLPFFWIPADNASERERRDRVPYSLWARQGFLETTPGNVIDYDAIRQRINGLKSVYDIREIAIDRWNAAQLTTQLQGDGFTVVPFGQGYQSMSTPSKELERMIVSHKLNHGANPVLRWQISNVAIEQDAAENIKPTKAHSVERIDGVVALVMAIGRAIAQPAQVETEECPLVIG